MKDFKNFKTYKKTKKNYSNIKRKIFLKLLLVLILAVFFYGIYQVFYILKNSQESKLRYVYIKGNKILQSNYLIHSLGISNNTKLNSHLKLDVYNKLKKNPFIENAKIAIIKPDTLYIDINEKTPLCILEVNNKQLLFSNDGQYITDNIDPKKIKVDKILHIKMANLTPQINDKKVLLTLVNLYKKLDKLEKISYIIMEDNKFGVNLKNGIMVTANMFNCDYDKSIKRLEIIWPKLLPDTDKIENVSICYPDRIIIKWKTKETKSGR
ncbi:MAG: cell division protein FtsQ/DivIB [Desulfurella sp.]